MSQPVILKSNRYGINLILDNNISFAELKKAVLDKFKESEKFFKNASIAISFEGRILSGEEELELLDLIAENTSIHVVCVVDHDELREQLYKEKIDSYYNNVADNTGEFYKGTLRSGQVLKCDSSIVIIGDVNPGAKIIARGNIVIIGALKGNAYAGAAGDESCFVTALTMEPVQIKIGNVIGRSADKGPWEAIRNRKRTMEPQMAMVSDGNILIEPITRELLNSI
ncbi:MAG: septum site-determining protein MinC [Lachnospiraceae bacterium]|uniref:septum site-determining protein MinC n=1 Tax=Roseburia hominis TaxID=301301 RepID=UPI001F1F5225|nr:septum site-determining protein MinC [Roseburia hominis]MCI5713083.1 septum site-determining protein MinC [Lachnospiraceae bacterium]MDD6169578.1 septum site-determining protein MinC [Lachnospiraceae bacterium]MDY4838705.1 septum site-determining protein MinC [Lachnospiraceae bacterium]